ncbi:MAG: DNA repair protein RadC, partial [Candidatus Subteraquimicrobiales bacterium]|nr:DNA repair protein RadC [Candidatus Subteraquimicrobiales bacterium]
GESVLNLSQRVLGEFESLEFLNKASPHELVNIEGIGKAKAAQILAAFELGRRLSSEPPTKRRVISCPDDVAKLLMSKMRYFDREHFRALILNVKNEVLRETDISIGSLSSSIVHPRELFKMVLKYSGSGVIIAHNHPSGDSNPSTEDVLLTKRLSESAKILGIDLIDHVIIGNGKYVSLKENGYLL